MFFVWFAVFHRHFLDFCTSTAISPTFTFTFSETKKPAECRRIKHSLRARNTNELLCPFELPASKKENLVGTMLPLWCVAKQMASLKAVLAIWEHLYIYCICIFHKSAFPASYECEYLQHLHSLIDSLSGKVRSIVTLSFVMLWSVM